MTQCKFTFLSTWPRLLAVQERHKAAPFVRLRPPPLPKNENHAAAPLPIDIKILLGGDTVVLGI